MKIKIKDHEIELKYTLRSFTIYEQLTGSGLNFSDINTIEQIVTLFFANVLGSLQKSRQPLDITYDDLWDYIDDNGGNKVITEFSEWFVKQMEAQNQIAKLSLKDKSNKDKTNKDNTEEQPKN